jgi:hypothetical protein
VKLAKGLVGAAPVGVIDQRSLSKRPLQPLVGEPFARGEPEPLPDRTRRTWSVPAPHAGASPSLRRSAFSRSASRSPSVSVRRVARARLRAGERRLSQQDPLVRSGPPRRHHDQRHLRGFFRLCVCLGLGASATAVGVRGAEGRLRRRTRPKRRPKKAAAFRGGDRDERGEERRQVTLPNGARHRTDPLRASWRAQLTQPGIVFVVPSRRFVTSTSSRAQKQSVLAWVR